METEAQHFAGCSLGIMGMHSCSLVLSEVHDSVESLMQILASGEKGLLNFDKGFLSWQVSDLIDYPINRNTR
jgi:hypothetical protein